MCKKSKREDAWTENKIIRGTILTTNQTQENEVHKWNNITRVIQFMLWVSCYWLWNHEHKIMEMNSLWAKLTTHGADKHRRKRKMKNLGCICILTSTGHSHHTHFIMLQLWMEFIIKTPCLLPIQKPANQSYYSKTCPADAQSEEIFKQHWAVSSTACLW